MRLEHATVSPAYPTIAFLVRHGGWLFALIALLPLAGSAALLASGAPPWALAAGAIASAVAYLLLRAFLELIRVISDLLLPRP